MPHYTILMAAMSLVFLVQGAYARTGEAAVKLQMRDRMPVVDGVLLNGHGPYRFAVDTGSAVNQIEPALAETQADTDGSETASCAARVFSGIGGAFIRRLHLRPTIP